MLLVFRSEYTVVDDEEEELQCSICLVRMGGKSFCCASVNVLSSGALPQRLLATVRSHVLPDVLAEVDRQMRAMQVCVGTRRTCYPSSTCIEYVGASASAMSHMSSSNEARGICCTLCKGVCVPVPFWV
jgi:hypothetical protein